jgi:glycogen debranching enzyme
LLRQNRRLDWSARKIADAGHPVVCELIVNVLWGLSLLASGEESITPRIVERFWDEDRGLFLDVVRKGSKERQVDISTWTALAPLALPDLPEEIGRRLVDEHLLASDGYWTPVPVPSVAVSEPEFEPRKWKSGPIRRYWMGPSWGNSAWLIWLGLNRLGYEKEAAEMEKAWLGCYVREGSWEFYEPYSGEGMGARDFGWTSLVAEFADPDPLGLTSWV